MAKERKLKTLTYKQAVFHEAGPNLKQVLEKALKEKPTVGQRREALSGGEESPVWRLVGEFVVEKEFVFGVLMRYMPGLNPAFVVDDESLKTLTIKQVAVPQTDDGKRRELLDGMLFFGVFDNHLVLMQSASLRSDHLEHHVQWLLHQSGALIGTNTLRLIDGLPKATRDKLMEHQVREIDLGGALVPVAKPTLSGDQDIEGREGTAGARGQIAGAENRAKSLSVTMNAASANIVQALKSLMPASKAAKLNLDALLASNIEYTLSIRYRQSTSEDGQRLMDTLGSALRHADGVETKIKLVGGGVIKGDDLKMSGQIRIDTYDGLPSASEVFEEMRTWLLEKLKSGEVKA